MAEWFADVYVVLAIVGITAIILGIGFAIWIAIVLRSIRHG